MTTLHTLASGSSGNAALLSHDGVHLLLDAGISCRRIAASLQTLGLSLSDLSAVLITHTHTDHIAGLQTLLKKWDGPVCASEDAARDLRRRYAGLEDRLCSFVPGGRFTVDGCEVDSFPTSHDAPGSVGFRSGDAGLLTDTGYVTEQAAETLLGVPLLVLESNHDVDLLRSGPYPYYLKKRILSAEGHLSNADAACFAAATVRAGTRTLVLAHLSAENNTPSAALQTVCQALADEALESGVSVAPRDHLGPCHAVEERTVCKK